MDELAAAFNIIAESPTMTPIWRRVRGVGEVRRHRLSRSGYYVYYRYDERTAEIRVYSVWHTRRGRDPFG